MKGIMPPHCIVSQMKNTCLSIHNNIIVKGLAKTRKTSFNTCSFTEDTVYILTVKILPLMNHLETTSGILGALYIYKVKTINSDVENIPLTTCYSERKNALNGVVLLINDNLLSTCHNTEITHRVLKVLGQSKEEEEFVSDVLNVAHVSVACCSDKIIHYLPNNVKLFL
jgi:hypothetical protein